MLGTAASGQLSRGGQIFYVHNRIEGIYERAERLRQLFPDARIAVAHGQMAGKGSSAAAQGGETVLEKTMLDFVEGRYDILCATAIIESGLDIPRANTIIIDRADLFGLAQLYQLRGRVGRSKERAYGYLIVPPPNKMTDEARARIEALERHTELGSGSASLTLPQAQLDPQLGDLSAEALPRLAVVEVDRSVLLPRRVRAEFELPLVGVTECIGDALIVLGHPPSHHVVETGSATHGKSRILV